MAQVDEKNRLCYSEIVEPLLQTENNFNDRINDGNSK